MWNQRRQLSQELPYEDFCADFSLWQQSTGGHAAQSPAECRPNNPEYCARDNFGSASANNGAVIYGKEYGTATFETNVYGNKYASNGYVGYQQMAYSSNWNTAYGPNGSTAPGPAAFSPSVYGSNCHTAYGSMAFCQPYYDVSTQWYGNANFSLMVPGSATTGYSPQASGCMSSGSTQCEAPGYEYSGQGYGPPVGSHAVHKATTYPTISNPQSLPSNALLYNAPADDGYTSEYSDEDEDEADESAKQDEHPAHRFNTASRYGGEDDGYLTDTYQPPQFNDFNELKIVRTRKRRCTESLDSGRSLKPVELAVRDETVDRLNAAVENLSISKSAKSKFTQKPKPAVWPKPETPIQKPKPPKYASGKRRAPPRGTNHLWYFIWRLLEESPDPCLQWNNQHEWEFRILDSERLARLWGQHKNRPRMRYETLSRSLREYYKKEMMKKGKKNQKNLYCFLPACWLQPKAE